MSAASALLAGRRAAESLMLDAGLALHPTGEPVYVPELQVSVEDFEPMFGTLAEPVRCKVQTRTLSARVEDVGGRTAVTVRTELHLPADTLPLAVGDVWEFVTVHPLSLQTVGQRVRVVAPVAGSLKTARRYEVEEIAS